MSDATDSAAPDIVFYELPTYIDLTARYRLAKAIVEAARPIIEAEYEKARGDIADLLTEEEEDTA